MLGLGVVYLVVTPRKYLAEALVNVPGQSYLATLTAVRADQTGWWVSPAQGASNEIGELLQTDTFMKSIIAVTDLSVGLGGDLVAVQDLVVQTREDVWAVAQGDNQVLIGATHENPVVAYQLASALIDSYTSWLIDSELTQSGAAQEFFADLIPVYEAEVAAARQALEDYLQSHPPPVAGDRSAIEMLEITRLDGILTRAQARLIAAQESDESARLAALQTEVNVRQSFYVMDAPTIPVERAISKRRMAMELGIFVGVGGLLSVAAVAGGALFSRGYIFPADVNASLHLPVLASVPEIWQPQRRGRGDKLPVSMSPATAYVLSPVQSIPALPPAAPMSGADAAMGDDVAGA
jgi:hypothetical protein